jgi:hypothetical protein
VPLFPSTTLFPSGSLFPGTSIDAGISLGGGLNVTWWAIHPTTGARIALPDIGQWQLSPIANAPGSLSMDYPVVGRNYATLTTYVTDRRDLEVEVWFEGTSAGALRGVLCERSSDLVDDARTVSFSGHFLEWRMSKILVAPYASNPQKETAFSAVTPGTVMATLMARAHARGTATDITYATFTNTLDSNGVAWGALGINATYSPVQTTYLQVLDELVEGGFCEWDISPTKQLRLYVAGSRGTDRTLGPRPVVLRKGRNLIEVPTKVSSRDSGSDLWAAGGEGLFHLEFDATARAVKGRQDEVAFSVNNVRDIGGLDAATTARLPAVVRGKREVTHGILFGGGDPLPMAGFHVGDWVYSNTGETSAAAGGGNERLRIKQWTLSRTARGAYSGTISLNDLFDESLVKIATQLGRLQSGGAVVGTSTPRPDNTLPPAAPTGVIASSMAYVANGASVAAVTVGWSAVTTNSDGSAAFDISGYRVEWRRAADVGGWRLGRDQGGGTVTYTTFGGVEAGTTIVIRVYCYDFYGLTSAPSGEITLVTETDHTPPPVPSTPAVTPYLGQLKIRWNGLGSAGEAMPADLDLVEVHVSTASGFTPSTATLVDTFSTVAGERIVTDLPYGITYYVKLIAVDATRPVGNRSAPSAQASSITQQVVQIDIGPNAIGRQQIINLEVVTAKIDLLAVNDAQFGSGSFGKLTAGTISVAVTNAGIIRTGTTGQRTEQDSAGFRLYNAAGVKTIDLATATGMASITGTFQSNLSGDRIVINPATEPYPTIFFYDNLSGSSRAFINGVPIYGGRVGLGMNSSPNGYGFGTTLFLLPDEVWLQYNTTTGDVNKRRGGYFYLRRETVEMGVQYADPGSHLAAVSCWENGNVILDTSGSGRVWSPGVIQAVGGFTSGGAAELFTVGGGRIYPEFDGNGQFSWRAVNGQGLVKAFVIDHPVDADRWLVHGCTESPHAGVEDWGTVEVDAAGHAEVILPAYFEAAFRTAGRAVFLTPISDRPLTCGTPVASYPRDGRFTISAPGCARVSWQIKAVRADTPPLEAEPLRAAVNVRGDGPYRYINP